MLLDFPHYNTILLVFTYNPYFYAHNKVARESAITITICWLQQRNDNEENNNVLGNTFTKVKTKGKKIKQKKNC